MESILFFAIIGASLREEKIKDNKVSTDKKQTVKQTNKQTN